MTLEDEAGVANLIVRQEVWERDHKAARSARALLAFGRLQNQDGVVHLLSAGGWGLTLPIAAAALELDKHYELTDWDNP